MAHYAFLDENNFVTEVIIGIDETELIEGLEPEEWYSKFRGKTCKRTSYNSNIRKHYAAVGYEYNAELDAFIPPKPFNSWLLNEELCIYEAPIPIPDNDNYYVWNEDELNWELADFSESEE